MADVPSPRGPHTRISDVFVGGKLTFAMMLESKSRAYRGMIHSAKSIAERDDHVFVMGETGAGKDLVTVMIINDSERKNRMRHIYPLAGKSGDVGMTELMGAAKRRFSGVGASRGIFEDADGGVVVFPDIDNADPKVQAALLEVLERGFVRPQGGGKVKVNVRVFASTNRPIEWFQTSGQFRQDLFFRLNKNRLVVPSLRERREDLPQLFGYCLWAESEDHKRTVPEVAEDVLPLLKEYDWPGNVRELRTVVAQGLRDIEGGLLRAADLEVFMIPPTASGVAPARGDDAPLRTFPSRPVGERLDELEKWGITRSLILHGWNQIETAEALGIHRNTLRVKMRIHGISR